MTVRPPQLCAAPCPKFRCSAIIVCPHRCSPEDGPKHDLYLNWDEGFIYDDANRAVAYKIDGDAQQVFSELCAVISEYGTYTR